MENLSTITKSASINRLLVYFFWDADGIVDDYVVHSLKELRQHTSEIVVVVNGDVNEQGHAKLRSVSNRLIFRENFGMDAWAYKEAFESVGYDRISEFDEVLVTSFTLFGPIFPISDVFSRMASIDCDFWGLAGFNQKHDGHSDIQHIQSYFVVYRKSLTVSIDFREYWDKLPKIDSYHDSVNFHELSQTPYFSSRGYKFESFLPMEKYEYISPYNFVISCSDRILVEDSCPFIKRGALFFTNGVFEQGSSIGKIEYITNFIKGRTDYDVSLMLDNLERTQKPSGPEAEINSNTPRPVPISRYRHYKRLLGSYIHPRKVIRDELKKILFETSQIRTERDILWDRYINCFRLHKKISSPMELVRPNTQHVGRYTYGALDTQINSMGTVIGSFCSIGQRVVIGHGNHPKDFLSSSPFFYFDELGLKTDEMPTYDKFWFMEPVIIGNDVWIGDGVWIKNGVTIGDGAIIGARAVVTKDVKPYAIVAGIPADVIGYRFDEKTIQSLLESKWWKLEDDVIRKIPFDDIHKALEFLSRIKKDTP